MLIFPCIKKPLKVGDDLEKVFHSKIPLKLLNNNEDLILLLP